MACGWRTEADSWSFRVGQFDSRGQQRLMFIAYRGDYTSSRNLFVAEYANGTRIGINARDVDHITTSNIRWSWDSNNKALRHLYHYQGLKIVSNQAGTWLPRPPSILGWSGTVGA